MIGRKQAVEAEQVRQQRAEPKHRRANAREQRKVRTKREWHERHYHEKEQDADECASAEAHAEPHVAYK